MAEVYWDLEWTLQQQGFDYAYDKRLYDRLREHHARPVREHFHAGLDYQDKLARFLENHDEPRAAATFRSGRPQGRRRHHVPVAGPAFLPPGPVRGTQEADFAASLARARANRSTRSCTISTTACSRVLRQPAVRDGQWQLLECTPGWDGNWTHDCFLVFAWQGAQGRAARGRRQLRPQPKPVPRPLAVSRALPARNGDCRINSPPIRTIGMATICWAAGCISTWPPGKRLRYFLLCRARERTRRHRQP